MYVSTATIKEFAASCDLRFVSISRKEVAAECRVKHCRSGKIESGHPIKEARGQKVHAFGYDELSNIVALCADGHVRQFVK